MSFRKCTWKQDKYKTWTCSKCKYASKDTMEIWHSGNGYCKCCGTKIKEYIEYDKENCKEYYRMKEKAKLFDNLKSCTGLIVYLLGIMVVLLSVGLIVK